MACNTITAALLFRLSPVRYQHLEVSALDTQQRIRCLRSADTLSLSSDDTVSWPDKCPAGNILYFSPTSGLLSGGEMPPVDYRTKATGEKPRGCAIVVETNNLARKIWSAQVEMQMKPKRRKLWENLYSPVLLRWPLRGKWVDIQDNAHRNGRYQMVSFARHVLNWLTLETFLTGQAQDSRKRISELKNVKSTKMKNYVQ